MRTPRPSLLVQYICFVSLALWPWTALVFGGFTPVLFAMAGGWLVLGAVAAIWHRNIEEG